MREKSQRGYVGLVLLLLGAAAVAYFYYYGPVGPNGKPYLQEELNAMQSAKDVQKINDAHNQEIEQALKEY